jgi:hypothetical protein
MNKYLLTFEKLMSWSEKSKKRKRKRKEGDL